MLDEIISTSPIAIGSPLSHSLQSTLPPDLAFCQRLPKIEVHAHLTGSVTKECLQQIWEDRTKAEGDLGIEAPIKALADPSAGQNISLQVLKYIYKLISTPESLAYATRSVLNHFANDGVVHLELRTTPRPLANGTVSAEDAVRTVLAVIENWNLSSSSTDHISNRFPLGSSSTPSHPSTFLNPMRASLHRMHASLILSVDRAKHNLAQANEIVDLAITLRDEGLPVVGLDLCGDPNSSNNVARLAPAFHRARSLGLPLTLHYAEVPSSSSTSELYELLSWRPRRLGHAIHIPMKTRLQIIEADIALELCLSCNILARMLPDTINGGLHNAPSYEDHHFGWWWRAEALLSLGTDDVGVFGSRSSEEHQHAAKWWNIGRKGLLELSQRAMRGAFANEAEQRRVEGLFQEFEAAEQL